MKRTQIYLTNDQWRRLAVLSRETRRSVADMLRGAVDRVYMRKRPNFEKALDRMAGIWRDRKDIGSADAYVRRLRKDSRLRRLYPTAHG